LIAHAVPDVFVNLITLVGVSLVLFNINPQLAVLSMAPIPLVFLSLRVYARRVRPAFVKRQVELGDLNATLNDNLTGIREIKAFTREEEELLRVGVRVDRYLRSNLNALRLMAIFQPFVEFTSSLGLLIVIYFGGRLASAPGAAHGRPGGLFPVPGNVLPAGADFEQCLGAGPELTGRGGPGWPTCWRKSRSCVLDRGRFELLSRASGGTDHFRRMCISSYADGNTVLEEIDLHIPAHSITALVGPPGLARAHWSALSRASMMPTRVRSHWMDWISVRSPWTACAGR
jgi:ATP-binding cassette, subfamily B, bacterial